jgi:hypothetical protein
MLIATVCATSGCFPGSAAPTGLGISSGGSGGETASRRLAFLVQPNDVSAGDPITPEVKVLAVDSLGRVLPEFIGRVSVTLGSGGSGGSLSGTTSVTASGGLAIFPRLVVSQAGRYTLTASAPGLVSVSSTTFVVF